MFISIYIHLYVYIHIHIYIYIHIEIYIHIYRSISLSISIYVFSWIRLPHLGYKPMTQCPIFLTNECIAKNKGQQLLPRHAVIITQANLYIYIYIHIHIYKCLYIYIDAHTYIYICCPIVRPIAPLPHPRSSHLVLRWPSCVASCFPIPTPKTPPTVEQSLLAISKLPKLNWESTILKI